MICLNFNQKKKKKKNPKNIPFIIRNLELLEISEVIAIFHVQVIINIIIHRLTAKAIT